jgi:hypothetical protein
MVLTQIRQIIYKEQKVHKVFNLLGKLQKVNCPQLNKIFNKIINLMLQV